MEEAGFRNVVSVPEGANPTVRPVPKPSKDKAFAYVWNCWAATEQAACILLATDDDGPGHALAEELARRLGIPVPDFTSVRDATSVPDFTSVLHVTSIPNFTSILDFTSVPDPLVAYMQLASPCVESAFLLFHLFPCTSHVWGKELLLSQS